MQFQKISFRNNRGQRLAARLDLPVNGAPAAYALFAHCFTCSKNLSAVGNISRAMNRAGIAVMRFDFTGLGESEGDFADTNFSSNVEDLVAAADYMRTTYEAPRILIGHSLGGAAVLQAAGRIGDLSGVVTIGAPAEPAHIRKLLSAGESEIVESGSARVELGGRSFTITRQFLDDLDNQKMQRVISLLKKPLLIFHSPVDNIVGIENAARIFQAARHPKSFISLDHADHLLSDEADSEYVGALVASWARKYIGQSVTTSAREPAESPVWVHTGKTGLRTEINANGHSLIADEPAAVGGTNNGPTPYDFLVAALGACTSMTLRLYADRKKWPLEGIDVYLAHRKVHLQDCQQCESSGSKVDHIDREIAMHGDLDQAQKARLLEIADRCPVHRTLHSDIHVTTREKAAHSPNHDQ